ncbi:PadR family transcriptional regulator [Ruania zhangjianzhongii]|uniref:PadR family transcriptional regulator n=1 Tax=Ruania zhangjianzhongii TaxID=2603206 RepID=UPI0011C8069F|nr:PadR family transcriptional regulator [Ruania zhangjianzhongii]
MSDEPIDPRWPTPWVRAALGTATLAVLSDGPLHGYGIAVTLAERGFGRPKGGSLYPLLATLEAEGAVTAIWAQGASGPGRKTYALTDAGRARLAQERASWSHLVEELGHRGTAERSS